MSRSSDGRSRSSCRGPAAGPAQPERLFAAGGPRASIGDGVRRAQHEITLRPITRSTPRSISSRRGAFSWRLASTEPAGDGRATAQRLVEAAHQVCPIREQRTGTSPSKRRWV